MMVDQYLQKRGFGLGRSLNKRSFVRSVGQNWLSSIGRLFDLV